MQLPSDVRARFRRHGRTGGHARASRLDSATRTGIARRAAMARWIRKRFGKACFEDLGVPGGEIVDVGLADLAHGKVSAESLAVSIAAPRLRREGVPVGATHADPEERLYDLLSRRSPGLAHARYGAYLKQMASFADACPRQRSNPVQHARPADA